MQYFYSIHNDRSLEIKIKRSTFLCSLKYVETIEDTKKFISKISSEHKTATHNCWAYIVGEKADISHCSDNGEPAGTAGKPMLNILQSHEMTNIVSVVTRYFGGVKLGIRGLIDAYAQSVTQTLEIEKLTKLIKTQKFKIKVPYTFNDTLLYYLKNYPGTILKTDYTDTATHLFEVEDQKSDELEKFLMEYQGAGKLEFNQG